MTAPCPLALGTASALLMLCALPAQNLVHRGERVPASAISPLVVETLDTVLERQRTMQLPLRDLPVWNGQDGRWIVPAPSAKTPVHSGLMAIVNEWGDPRMAIGLGRPTAVIEVWAAGHGAAPARALRILGQRGDAVVARTEWIVLGTVPQRVPLGFKDVDRLVFEAAPTTGNAAFFALDDLRLQVQGQARTLDFEDLAHKAVLDGNYAGLTWPRGDGFRRKVEGIDIVPAPKEVPEAPEPAPPAPGAPELVLTATTPNVWDDRIGVTQGDPGATLIPPDTCGATGPDHSVVIVNANLSAFTRSNGTRVLNVSLNSFWNVTGLIGDPHVVFDPHSQRFIATSETFSGTKTIYCAVSQTADPAGAWMKFSFATDVGSDAGRWPDYVTLGVDARGFYSAAYMVGSPATMTVWAIDKAPLLAPTPAVGTITAFRGLPWEGAIQPCTTYGDPGVAYMVSRQSSTQMRVRYVMPPLTAPTLVEAGSATIPSHSAPPNAPALGSTTPISTTDTRPMNAVFRNGSIWTAHGIGVSSRSACRWYQVSVTPVALVQSGTIADPLWHYYYATIAVDRNGDVGIGFSGSHASAYCSAFATGRRAGDPAGITAPPVLVKAGEASWNRLDSSGRNRFGDYSHTDVDPIDDVGFWTNQEYIAPSTDTWRTRITRIGFEAALYGDGLAGTNGVPTIATAARPRIGTTLQVLLGHSGGPVPSPGVLLFGFQRTAVPILGGTMLVAAVTNLSVSVTAPFASVPIAVPNDPSLTNVPVYFQQGQIDAMAPQLVAISRGLEVRLGTR